MEKPECVQDFEEKRLVMSDEKCDGCPYVYECRFMMAEMNDVTYGGM